MNTLRLKICGITSADDALMAVREGADALGFLVGLDYPSNDEVSVDTAARISSEVPPFIARVLVTHRVEPAWIVETARTSRCTTVQLHGDFPPEHIPDLRAALPYLTFTRVVHVEHDDSVAFASAIAEWADAVHLDTKTATRRGGTGVVHDWRISARIVRQVRKPVILSGGLTAENVRDAIETVRPYAVDVNSGVDLEDGPRKSAARLHAFADSVRRAELELSLTR